MLSLGKMEKLREHIRAEVQKIGLSGVVSARSGDSSYAEAFGYRERANHIKNQISTRFGIASATKGFTAVGVAGLIEQGQIGFDTLVKPILGDRLENLHADITIRHLLGHSSGVGDYLDEDSVGNINDVVLAIPVQNLLSPGDYVPLLEKIERKFPPGERFSYSNSGFIILAMIIELVSNQSYQDFIEKQVFKRAGMNRSGFFRSDCLPDDTATGYIPDGDSWRSNVFNLPIKGSGDGGAYSTIEDVQNFWRALKGGHLLNEQLVSELLKPRQYCEKDKLSYGYGFWIDANAGQALLEGYDAGVSFRSITGLNDDNGYTVISNTSSGAWPIVRLLDDYFRKLY